jgi:hypothetical protein
VEKWQQAPYVIVGCLDQLDAKFGKDEAVEMAAYGHTISTVRQLSSWHAAKRDNETSAISIVMILQFASQSLTN